MNCDSTACSHSISHNYEDVIVGATNQCCITSQNSTCLLSRGACRGVSRQLLTKGTCLMPIFVLSYLCLYIRKVKWGSTVLTRERCLQTPKETSFWLPTEDWGVREGLFIVFSARLQREAFKPAVVCGGRDRRNLSLREMLLCLAQGAVSAG